MNGNENKKVGQTGQEQGKRAIEEPTKKVTGTESETEKTTSWQNLDDENEK